MNDLVVDNFAGGGGASCGIEWALGRSPDIAVNHCAEAIAMHEANHPSTRHFREDVWQVKPAEVCDGAPTSQQSLFEPLHTVTGKARFGLVTVHGQEYQIVDIGMRMLTPRELFAAQGFPPDYAIEVEFEGRPLTKTAQIARAGNSVCPPVAAAIVAANLGQRAVTEAA